MLYLFKIGETEYVVRPLTEISAEKVEVEFVARINGGRGRMPKPKKICANDLTLLLDRETAEKLSATCK